MIDNKIQSKVESALKYINPDCGYSDWVDVCMSLKNGGFPFEVFNSWSRGSAEKYNEDECQRKWDSFNESGGTTLGTLFFIASDNGWNEAEWFKEYQDSNNEPLDWDSVIGVDTFEHSGDIHSKKIQKEFIWTHRPQKPENISLSGEGLNQADYFEAVFKPDDMVFVCRKAYLNEGKNTWVPVKAVIDRFGCRTRNIIRSARMLSKESFKHSSDAGCWLVVNPVNPDVEAYKERFSASANKGVGIENSDITSFRNTLIECDSRPILEEQWHYIFNVLKLPVVAVVYSGSKSLHAIVRVNALDPEDYKEKTRLLHHYCKIAGLGQDSKTKDLSRLTRFPGAIRGQTEQKLLFAAKNPQPFMEWLSWAESQTKCLEGD